MLELLFNRCLCPFVILDETATDGFLVLLIEILLLSIRVTVGEKKSSVGECCKGKNSGGRGVTLRVVHSFQFESKSPI